MTTYMTETKYITIYCDAAKETLWLAGPLAYMFCNIFRIRLASWNNKRGYQMWGRLPISTLETTLLASTLVINQGYA
jgi:hypothetical protein